MGSAYLFVERVFRCRVLKSTIVFTVMLSALGYAHRANAQLCGQLGGVSISENFNTLAATGTNNQTVPSEFKFVEGGGNGNLTYSADNGAGTGGETYSYGANGSSDRALGELTSGNVQTTIGACFVNNTNHAITSFLISYTGEEWRRGANGGAADRLDFQYSTTADSLTSGTYINVDALDFVSPFTTTAGSRDGNAAANRTVFAPLAITPAAPIQPEISFYVRWQPTNISGANDGLAIDDFTIGAVLSPGLAADYNNSGIVDAADYVVWRQNLNQAVTINNDITPGTVVQQDYIEWINRFGKTGVELGAGVAVPEPGAIACLVAMAGATFFLRRM